MDLSWLYRGPPRAETVLRTYPNPFNPRTTVAFSLQQPGQVLDRVFDLSGRQVCTLAHGVFRAGEHTVDWDGRDDAGRAQASGGYLVRMETGGESFSRMITLVK